MNFLWYFRLSSYLLIGSGFLALLVTDEYGILSAIIFSAITLIGWRVDSGKLRLSIPSLFWNLTTIVVLVLCIADVLFIRKITSVGLINFLLFLQISKIMGPKQDRDYVILYVISFFALLISSIMTFSVLFAFSCLLFIVTGTWALITLHLKREIQTHLFRNHDQSPRQRAYDESSYHLPALDSLLNIRFFSGTFGITVATCMLSLIVFMLLPRFREGYFFRYEGSLTQKISGFSEEVALDTFGTIRLDHTPVMRVELPQIEDISQLLRRLYWKGISYNYYDGTRWKADGYNKKYIPWSSRYQSKTWIVPPHGIKTFLEQRIELSSSDARVLFAANTLYGVAGRFLNFEYDKFTENTQITLSPYALQYTVYSNTAWPSEGTLRSDHQNYSEEVRRVYLQLPELPDRIKHLADDISKGMDNVYDITVAVQNYLLQNYEYSLDVQRSSEILPLEDFLFVHQAGHCEYYATGMAILLRILGIPARVVNGFAQGRWNEFGKFFTVRQSDAHAWVEVYFPSYGWLSFDPTPSTAFGESYQHFAEKSGLFASVYRYSEYLRTRWNRYIIDYSLYDQARLAVDTFHATHSLRHNISVSMHTLRQQLEEYVARLSSLQFGMIIGIVLVGIAALRPVLRLLQRMNIGFPHLNNRSSSIHAQPIRFYTTMLRILAGKGIIKGETLTPEEFARYVNRKYPVYGQDVYKVTQLYYAVRYGQHYLQENERQKLENILQQLKKQRIENK